MPPRPVQTPSLPYFANNSFFVPVLLGFLGLIGFVVWYLYRKLGTLEKERNQKLQKLKEVESKVHRSQAKKIVTVQESSSSESEPDAVVPAPPVKKAVVEPVVPEPTEPVEKAERKRRVVPIGPGKRPPTAPPPKSKPMAAPVAPVEKKQPKRVVPPLFTLAARVIAAKGVSTGSIHGAHAEAVLNRMLEALGTVPAASVLRCFKAGNIHSIVTGSAASDAGVLRLARVFPALQSLDLSGASITDTALFGVAGAPLPAGEELCAACGELCEGRRVASRTSSQFFCSSRCAKSAAAGAGDEEYQPASTPGLHALKELRLARCGVTGAGLSCCALLPNLQTVDLTGAPVTDADVEAMLELESLQKLRLAGTVVTDDVCRVLAAHTRLTDLDLSGCDITDVGLTALAGSGSLRRVVLNETLVSRKVLAAYRSSTGVTVEHDGVFAEGDVEQPAAAADDSDSDTAAHKKKTA